MLRRSLYKVALRTGKFGQSRTIKGEVVKEERRVGRESLSTGYRRPIMH